MHKFFNAYWLNVSRLPKNPVLYMWFFVIIAGGNTVRGKGVAILISIAIAPLLQLWHQWSNQRLSEPKPKTK